MSIAISALISDDSELLIRVDLKLLICRGRVVRVVERETNHFVCEKQKLSASCGAGRCELY